MKIFITGGTGLIGKSLIKKLVEHGNEVIVLTRNKKKAQRDFPDFVSLVEGVSSEPGDWQKYLDGVDTIINLAGDSVASGRWTKAKKEKIYNSRIDTTTNIVAAIRLADKKPRTLINASATGFYGFQQDDRELDEEETSGKDFLANVCSDWEDASRLAEKEGVRVVRLRIGIVLSEKGGALEKMALPYKFYAGGFPGSGEQWISWIHIDDLVGIILFTLDNKSISGAVNGTAPYPLRMEEFCNIIGKVLKRPSWTSVPTFALQLAMGEASEIVIEGQRVIPKKITEAGYEFEFSEAELALENLLGK